MEATATDRQSTIEQFSRDGNLYSDPLAPPSENPLAGRVMQRAAAYGYSLGGMACQDLGAIATPMDGLKTIALAHSARNSLSRAARFNIPIIAGTGSADTLTPPFGPISIFSLYENLRSPLVHVTITGSPHVNSVCGNQCPAVVVPCCQGSTNMPKHMRWFNGFFQVRTCHRPFPTRNTFELCRTTRKCTHDSYSHWRLKIRKQRRRSNTHSSTSRIAASSARCSGTTPTLRSMTRRASTVSDAGTVSKLPRCSRSRSS